MRTNNLWGKSSDPIRSGAQATEREKAQPTDQNREDAHQDARPECTDRAGRDEPAGASSAGDADNDSPAAAGKPEVAVCPECDRSTIERRNPGWFGRATSDHRWACWKCGARFDEPVKRESRSNGTHSLTGLAKDLYNAEPDDLVTDGGQDVDAWAFERWQLVRDDRDRLWHITARWEDVDTGSREYFIEDATWTRGERRDADWFEDEAEATGTVVVGTKPAVELGYRVNGLLCGPDEAPDRLDRDRERGRTCTHDLTPCSHCDTDDPEEIDVVMTPSSSAEANATWCRVCGHVETHTDQGRPVTDGGRDATVPESLTALRILALLVDDSPRPDTLLRREIERHTGQECTDFGAALDSLERKGHIQRVSGGIVPTERGVVAGATEHGWLAARTGQHLVSTDAAHWPDDMAEYESERRTRIEGGDDVRTDGGATTATATARPTFDTPLSYQARCGNPDCRSLVGMSDNYCGHCGFEIDWPTAEDVDDEDVGSRLLTGGDR